MSLGFLRASGMMRDLTHNRHEEAQLHAAEDNEVLQAAQTLFGKASNSHQGGHMCAEKGGSSQEGHQEAQLRDVGRDGALHAAEGVQPEGAADVPEAELQQEVQDGSQGRPCAQHATRSMSMCCRPRQAFLAWLSLWPHAAGAAEDSARSGKGCCGALQEPV